MLGNLKLLGQRDSRGSALARVLLSSQAVEALTSGGALSNELLADVWRVMDAARAVSLLVPLVLLLSLDVHRLDGAHRLLGPLGVVLDFFKGPERVIVRLPAVFVFAKVLSGVEDRGFDLGAQAAKNIGRFLEEGVALRAAEFRRPHFLSQVILCFVLALDRSGDLL